MNEERLKEILRGVVQEELKGNVHINETDFLPVGMDKEKHIAQHKSLEEWAEFFDKIDNIKWIVPRTIVKVATSIVVTIIVMAVLSYFGLRVVATGGG